MIEHLALRKEHRIYTCPVCGFRRLIEVKRIEKSVVVCLHKDTLGGDLPIVQLREEGVLVDAPRP